MGNFYLLGKKPEEARKKAELVLEKDPNNIDGLMLLSGIQIQEKNTEDAIQTLEKAIGLDPEQIKVRLALGRVFSMEGKYEKAMTEYEKALAQEPTLAVASVELSRLYLRAGRADAGRRDGHGLQVPRAAGPHPDDARGMRKPHIPGRDRCPRGQECLAPHSA